MDSGSTLIFVLLFSAQHAFCYSGDPVMYLPPFEVRTLRDGRQGLVPPQQYQGNRSPTSQLQQQTILHTSQGPAQFSQPATRSDNSISEREPKDSETFSELADVLKNFEDTKEPRQQVSNKNELPRSAYDYPPQPYGYRPPPYGYEAPSYGPSYGYHEPSHVPVGHHTASKISLLKPDLGDLVKPVTTKVAGKVSGLIGLVLALLTGSAPNDLELKGFKDIVINGIVKPLLLAKGGIKSLISKLTIPVISLLLINLEVLVTIWWLWEDCPENTPPPYSYPKPSYGYNTYR